MRPPVAYGLTRAQKIAYYAVLVPVVTLANIAITPYVYVTKWRAK